ncbi:Nucleotidyl_cyclase [Hexamita inflata]|uniref:Nucleotidyl cyclase n=1 Tax=Hexamita inflata TaxID=28002 RepID=A0AA86QJV1_9EUKA|nr:Nucleotidyl cyclase [Hexamita inflata]
MHSQVNFFELSVLIQIVYNVYIIISFLLHEHKQQGLMEFFAFRADQFSDMLFAAFILGGLQVYKKKGSSKDTIAYLSNMISREMYCRLIVVMLQGMVIDQFTISITDIVLTISQYSCTLIYFLFNPEQQMTAHCLPILITCLIQWSYKLSKSIVYSVLMSIAFGCTPLFGQFLHTKTSGFTNIDKSVRQLNKMGKIIVNAFTNSLPNKILPKIMKAERLPCDIVNNVNFCYLYILGENENGLAYISRLNQFYSLLDFFSEILGVQKVKCSHQYYMCCTGAQKHLNNESKVEEMNYDNAYDSSKLLFTFSLISVEVAKLFGFKCTCGITKGDVVMGAVSVSTSIINFDTYGDVINTAARIARNNPLGVYISVKDFRGIQHENDDQMTETDDDNQFQQMMQNKMDTDKSKQLFLKAPPQYAFGQRVNKEYKGKGILAIQKLDPTRQLKQYTCQAFQQAYMTLIAECFTLMQDEDYSSLMTQLDDSIESSLMETSESFVSNSFSEYSETTNSTDFVVRLQESNEYADQMKSDFTSTNTTTTNNSDKVEPIDGQLLPKLQSSDQEFDIKLRISAVSGVINSKDGFNESEQPLISKNYQIGKKSGKLAKPKYKKGGKLTKKPLIDQEVVSDCESTDVSTSEEQHFDFEVLTRHLEMQSHIEHVDNRQAAYSASESIEFSFNPQNEKNKQDNNLLNPQLHQFFEQAKISNSLRKQSSTLPSQIMATQDNMKDDTKFHLQLIEEEEEIQHIYHDNLNIDMEGDIHMGENDSDQINSTSDIKLLDHHNTTSERRQSDADFQLQFKEKEKKLPQPIEMKPLEKQIREMLGIHSFMKQFSKEYCNLMSTKLEVLDVWINSISLKYYMIELIVIIVNLICAKIVLCGDRSQSMIFSMRFETKKLYETCCYVYTAGCLFFSLYQIHFVQLLNKELQQQKKKYNEKQLVKLLWGQFYKFNKVYDVCCGIIQSLKQLTLVTTLQSYKNLNISLNNQSYLLVLLIIDVFLYQLINLINGNFVTNMISVISFNYSQQLIQSTMLCCLYARQLPLLAVFQVIYNLILTIYKYSRLKPIMVDSKMKTEMQDQIQHGKRLLKNILPQITIDALLLTTLDKDSKDIVILSDRKHDMTMLHTIDELLAQQELPVFKQTLFESNTNKKTDYYQLRLSQLIYKYLKMPNPRSFGAQRPAINFGNVAYLNLDVCSFTTFCSQHNAQQNMHFLSSLFNKFDERIKMAKNLIQVKISGDSYELLSQPTILKKYSAKLNFPDEKVEQLLEYESIIQLIAVGLGFIQDCKEVLQNYAKWKNILGIRVGISFGQVTGSLLGNKICRFDTFGNVPIEAEDAQTNAPRNTIMLNQKVVDKLDAGEAVINDYIVDYLTSETLRSRKANYGDEAIVFDYTVTDYGKVVQGIKAK